MANSMDTYQTILIVLFFLLWFFSFAILMRTGVDEGFIKVNKLPPSYEPLTKREKASFWFIIMAAQLVVLTLIYGYAS